MNACFNRVKAFLALEVKNLIALTTFWDLDKFAEILNLAKFFDFFDLWANISLPTTSSFSATPIGTNKFSNKLIATLSIKMSTPVILLKP